MDRFRLNPLPSATLATLVVCAAIQATTFIVVPSHAQSDPPPLPGSVWTIDDDDPEASVPPDQEKLRNPLAFSSFLMDLSFKAEEAWKNEDQQASAKYHRALAKAVPDMALPRSRLCQAYLGLGDRERALDSCRRTLGLQGVVVDDFVRYGELLLTEKELAAEQLSELEDIVGHLKNEPDTGIAGIDLECKLGVKLVDQKRLENCIAEFGQASPDDPRLITYQWVFAIKQGDADDAWQLVERAKVAGFAPAGIERMIETTKSVSRAWMTSPLSISIALSVFVLVVGAGLLWFLRRKRSSASAS